MTAPLAAVAEVALFRSIESALRFCFDIAEYPAMSRPPLGQWLAPAGRNRGKGMTTRDWHAQGALIRRYIETELPPDAAGCLVAMFASGQAKERAIQALLRHPDITACFSGTRVVVEAVLRRYCAAGRKPETLRANGQGLGVHHTTVMRAERRMREALSRLFAAAEQRLSEDFQRFGLIDDC